jgi:iron complex outermembrane recepter protein
MFFIKIMLKLNFSKIATVCFLTVLASIAAFGQTGTIRGTVTSQVNDSPVAGVSVQITQLQRSVETDENGVYEFANLAPGRYTVTTHIEGYSDQARSVQLVAGANAGVDFALSLNALREEVTVTTTGTEESVFESFQSVNSVGSARIQEQASTSVGEVLEREAGVGKRAFGTGSARPVIRGFDGDRVLILQDGVRNNSLGSQSGDHGEPLDPLGLERLEVIKGPATLLYGSNAIGGVVNAVSTDEDAAHEGLRGAITGLGGTTFDQAGLSGNVEYGFKNFLFKFNGSGQRTGDYDTPLGRIPNSASRATNFGGSIGYFGEKGFLNGYFNADRRRYGVPYAPLFEEGIFATTPSGEPCKEEPEGKGAEPCEFDIYAIRDQFSRALPPVPEEQIDLKMRRYNGRLNGGFRNLNSPIAQGNFYLDFSDYRHREIETADGVDEVATVFDNDVVSYRSILQQAKYKILSGRFGFEGFRRSYLTEGAEALVEGRVRQNNFAAFALQELDFDRVSFQFGGRIENNRYRPTNPANPNRNFTGFSGAAAARVRLWEGAAFIANFTSSFRAPALEELYNEGPHIGTVTFEIGNNNLRRERSNGIELSFRQKINRVRIDGSFFHYNINDFVFLAPQDEDGDGRIDVEDNLPVAAYLQGDSRYTGADVTVDVDINRYLGAFFIGDVVKAKLKDGDVPLPRITPARARVGLDFRYKGLSLRPEGVFVADKDVDDIFPLETPTAGYGLFNVNGSYVIGSDRFAHVFSFGAFNLPNRLYRNHLSFIKDLAPEAGRGIRASYTFRFF